MKTTFNLSDKQIFFWNRLKLIVIGLVALSVSLPIAWISLAKVFLLVGGIVNITFNHLNDREKIQTSDMKISKLIWLIIIIFLVSVLWSVGYINVALVALIKHAKILEIPLLFILIKNIKEARVGIFYFMIGQTFLLISSWLLFLNIDIPWAFSSQNNTVVFSSYLDQSMIFVAMAAIFWHLRNENIWPKALSITTAFAALTNVFLFLDGRTGHIMGIAAIALSTMWVVPKKYRIIAFVVTPFFLTVALFFGSNQFQNRILTASSELGNYMKQGEIHSSSGWRLNAWHQSVKAIIENPLYGHGVGSWAVTVKRIQGDSDSSIFAEGSSSNPHQEFLLWGVELGLGGIFLLIIFLLFIAREAWQFSVNIQRAVLAVLAALIIACLFNSAIFDDLIGDYFCIVLGLLMALGFRTKEGLQNHH